MLDLVWPRKFLLDQALQKWTGRGMRNEAGVIMPCLGGLIHHMVDAELLQNL